MQRLARLEINSDNQSLIELLSNYDQLEKVLLRHLPFSTVSIFARPVLQGNIVEWYTELQGQPKLLDPKSEIDRKKLAEINPFLKDRLSQIDLLTKDLHQKGLIEPQQALQLEKLVATAINSNVQIYLINNEPVITSWGEEQKTVTVPPIAPSARKLNWLWWLLPLLLLLLASLLYWWYLQSSKSELPPEPPKLEQVKEEPIINKEPEVVIPKEESSVEPAKVCYQKITPAEAPQMVVIFNNASGMRYTIKETKEKVAAFDERLSRERVSKADIKYMTRKPNRSSASKIALNKIIDSIDPNIDIGLVELKSCLSSSAKSSAAVSHGIFTSSQRSKLQQKINKMSVRAHKVPGTPIYEGLQKALKMVDGVEREAFILLITEGNGDCTNRYQCSLIAEEIQKRPKLKINIVSINSPWNDTDCLALKTGGKIFNTEVSNEQELTDMINNAVKGVRSEDVCE